MNIRDLLTALNVPFRADGHEHCRPGWVQTDCPFCTPGTGRFRLGHNLGQPYCNCWSCGRVSQVEALALLAGIPAGRAWQQLRGVTGASLPQPRVTGTLKIPEGVGELLPPHRKYLRKRGFDPDEVAEAWGVRGIGVAPRLQWRLFIPVVLRGEVVSWTTRSVSDRHHARYRSAAPHEEKISHKKLLYGEDMVRHAVVVCEGPLDAWAVGPGAVATFGTGYSARQAARLARFPVRVVCFDAEEAAQRRARRLCDTLEAFEGETWNVILPGKDPAASPRRVIRDIRRRFLQ